MLGGAQDPLVEVDLGLEAEDLARLGDRRDAQLDVGVVPVHLDDDVALSLDPELVLSSSRPRVPRSVDDLRPYVAHLLACFGPERLLWGSDWPVATLAAAYDQWLAAAERLTATLTPAERAAIFGGNAARIYLTKRGRRPLTSSATLRF